MIPTTSSMSPAISRALESLTFWCREIISDICLLTGMTGLREVMGSWKIIEIFSPRIERISASSFSRRFAPSKRMRPPETLP